MKYSDSAHAQGLGDVWQELYPYHKRVAAERELLEIPATVYPMAVVAIGHPLNQSQPVVHYDSSKVMKNRWNRTK